MAAGEAWWRLTGDELEMVMALLMERSNSLAGMAAVWPAYAERRRQLGQVVKKLERMGRDG